MNNTDLHNQIVKKVIDTKAVDFNAIGKVISELGPALSFADDDGITFCGTVRRFIVICRIDNPGIPIESLGELRAASGELRD